MIISGLFAFLLMLTLAVVYILAAVWVADRFAHAGFSYWTCVGAGLVTPPILCYLTYLLADYAIGVVLSGGFH